MGERSGIAYVHHSWGPWRGCQPIAVGCDACYAARDQRRYGRDPSVVVRASAATFRAPLKWDRAARAAGERRRVFVTPWSDFWHPEADAWRSEAFELVRECAYLDFVSPTKRLEHGLAWLKGWVLPPNFWPLASVSTQADADAAIPLLLQLPALLRGVSYEPAIGPVDFSPWLPAPRSPWHGRPAPATWADLEWFAWVPAKVREEIEGFWGASNGRRPAGRLVLADGSIEVVSSCGYTPPRRLGWIVAGAESLSHTTPGRPAELQWFRAVRDQCAAAGVPFYLKQAAIDGRLVHDPALDGRVWAELPRR